MEPAIHNLPSHRTGTTWGYAFDFSDYGSGYLTGCSARFVVVGATGALAYDLTLGQGLTVAAVGDLTDVLLEINERRVELVPGVYRYELLLELSDGRAISTAEGSWIITPTRIPPPAPEPPPEPPEEEEE